MPKVGVKWFVRKLARRYTHWLIDLDRPPSQETWNLDSRLMRVFEDIIWRVLKSQVTTGHNKHRLRSRKRKYEEGRFDAYQAPSKQAWDLQNDPTERGDAMKSESAHDPNWNYHKTPWTLKLHAWDFSEPSGSEALTRWTSNGSWRSSDSHGSPGWPRTEMVREAFTSFHISLSLYLLLPFPRDVSVSWFRRHVPISKLRRYPKRFIIKKRNKGIFWHWSRGGIFHQAHCLLPWTQGRFASCLDNFLSETLALYDIWAQNFQPCMMIYDWLWGEMTGTTIGMIGTMEASDKRWTPL